MLRSLSDSEFQLEVREHADPIIIMFHGSWNEHSLPSKNMKPAFEEIASQMKNDIRFAYMNADDSKETMTQLNIHTLPSVALFVDGMVREIYWGSMNKSDLRYWIYENI